MFLQNENQELVNVEELKISLLDLKNIPDTSSEELNKELENLYSMALAKETGENVMIAGTVVGDLLRKIKKFVCSKIDENSTTEEIIDAILQALASIIPGGIIIKLLVEKLVKFILTQGITNFCSI